MLSSGAIGERKKITNKNITVVLKCFMAEQEAVQELPKFVKINLNKTIL